MPKFVVQATVGDKYFKNHKPKFKYKILDNENYIISESGGIEAKDGYTPKIGDKITVEVSCKDKYGNTFKNTQVFTVKV